jgi:hypothetical protein
MRNIIAVLLLCAIAWKGYEKYSSTVNAEQQRPLVSMELPVEGGAAQEIKLASGHSFVCDGRTYCSEMKSCAEAKYFLKHCPNVKMDGNNDGTPCETQWCK